MQRYKLFYNEAVLSLIKDEHATQTQTNLKNCFIFNNSMDLDDMLNSFFTNNQSFDIVYKTDDEKELWEKIKKYFVFQRAAGGLVFKNNHILSIYRFDRWDFPKGHVETGETDMGAAIREVMEETGIEELSVTKDLGYTYHIYPLSDQFVLKETRWYEMHTTNNQQLVPQQEESITKAEWIPIRAINKITENTYPALIDLLQRI